MCSHVSLCVCVCVICNSSVIVLFGCVLVVSLFTYDCRSRCSCVYAACSRRVHDWRASPSRPKTLTRGRLHRSRWQCHLEYSTEVMRTPPTGAATAQLSAWIPRGAGTQHTIGTLKHTHTHTPTRICDDRSASEDTHDDDDDECTTRKQTKPTTIRLIVSDGHN